MEAVAGESVVSLFWLIGFALLEILRKVNVLFQG